MNRLDIFYEVLKQVHKEHCSQMRVGQFIMNFIQWHSSLYGNDIFYVCDKDLLPRIVKFAEEMDMMELKC